MNRILLAIIAVIIGLSFLDSGMSDCQLQHSTDLCWKEIMR